MRALVALALLTALTACPAPPPPRRPIVDKAGISLALYADAGHRYGVVEDRRWLDIQGTNVLLGNIDPGAALASLVIETENPAVHIGPCTRDKLPEPVRDPLAEYGAEQERLAAERFRYRMRRPLPNVPRPPDVERDDVPRYAPIVSCAVAGPPGRQLVRIVYVSSTLTYRTQHDIEMTDPGRATIDSRYAITTPPWRERADVVLFDGVPGSAHAPRELARGQITLDGGTNVLVLPRRQVAAQLRRVYVGTVVGDDPDADYEEDPVWLQESLNAVWAMLELPGVKLSPGSIRVHVELGGEPARWIDVPPEYQPKPGENDQRPLRLALWIDDTLRGLTQRFVVENDGQRMVESFSLAVTNIGEVAREVWIEERVRRAKRRRVERSWPKKPTASGDTVRSVVEVQPGRAERVGYLVVYEL